MSVCGALKATDDAQALYPEGTEKSELKDC